MTCVVIEKGKLTAKQYDNVSNIAYNAITGSCTITYGNNQSVSYNTSDYKIYVNS